MYDTIGALVGIAGAVLTLAVCLPLAMRDLTRNKH